METITFEDLGLDGMSLEAVEAKGFTTPTPIQILAIPRLLNGEANVIAKARTGTGKTAAFGLPIIQNLRNEARTPKALILVPTRELALQVEKELFSLINTKNPRITSLYGGQSMMGQIKALKHGVEIVVGTPGRVQDHINRKTLDISQIDYFILDEADEMLDMGFIEDIENIFSGAPENARVLMFSATMSKEILGIASKFMGNYEIVQEEIEEQPVLQEQFYLLIREKDKTEALTRIIDANEGFYGLVFCQTKQDTDMLAKTLDEKGYQVGALHGDIAQSQREKVLYRFRIGKTRILVATDVAARGIDIEGLTHVINYSIPFDGPTYVHRIGRTGRAGARGIAVTFVRPDERRKINYLRGLTKAPLKEMALPSAEELLKEREKRIFNNITQSLSGYFNGEKKIPKIFKEYIGSVIQDKNPEELAAAILAGIYSREIFENKYTEIEPVKISDLRESGRSRNRERVSGRKTSPAPGKTRLFVSLGKRDNCGKKEVADFFAKLLNIPQRFVDDIVTTENFSLVTISAKDAERAIRITKKNRDLPHIHIDSESEQNTASLYKKKESGKQKRR